MQTNAHKTPSWDQWEFSLVRLYFLSIVMVLGSIIPLGAQSVKGITGIRDSSYTTAKAYENDVKNYPNIEVVQEFDFKELTETPNVTYCSIGERKLALDVYEDVSGTNRQKTAVLIVHGGGWRSGNRTQHHPMAQRLAALGYVCFTPEYRLSTEALFPAAIYDLKAAIRWVRANAVEYGIDPERIVVLGFSAGGELAAFLGTTANMPLFEGTACHTEVGSEVQAIIDIDGILSFVHPESGEGDDSNGISAATNWFGYSRKENPLLWEAGSALGYANAFTPPTLFINSAVDRMHAGREDYIAILKAHGTYTQTKTFEGAPHSFCLYQPWFDPTISEIDGFIRKVLP